MAKWNRSATNGNLGKGKDVLRETDWEDIPPWQPGSKDAVAGNMGGMTRDAVFSDVQAALRKALLDTQEHFGNGNQR